MPSNTSKLKFARVVIYVWLAIWVGLFVAGPFLPQPLRLYAGHAMYVTVFGGIVAAIVATRIWIGPYMPKRKAGETAAPRVLADADATSRIRMWNVLVAAAALAAVLLLPRLGVHLDREQIYAAVLAVSVVVICAFYALRHIRQRRV